jgi:P pilus assembly chaperone PapD
MNKSYLLLYYLLLNGLSVKMLRVSHINITPTSIHIKDQDNVAYLYIYNDSEEIQGINISFEFSYPGSDSEGNLKNLTEDIAGESKYGLTDNLKVFPRQFVLKPGCQQKVRIQARPLTDKTDGTYWTRLIVSSYAVSKDVASQSVTMAPGSGINYIFRQNIPVFYLKGKVNTGLIAGDITTSVTDGKLVAVASMKPTGNSPFNGIVTARLIDHNGKDIAVQQQAIVAYFEVLRRIEITLPSEGLAPGTYKLKFTFETTRDDISPSDLVQTAPVIKITEMEIN